MLEKDVILSKISSIKNCLKTINKATQMKIEKMDDVLVQDVFVLNIQRAVQACIDIANIIIAEKNYKLPTTYKESFEILLSNKIISKTIYNKMIKMVGFRNIAVHDYQRIEIDILKSILFKHLKDFEQYYSAIYNKVIKSSE